MTAEAAPPCLACGACCFSNLAEYVRVSGADHARIGERAEVLTTFIGNRCYMRMSEGHCAALLVDVANRRFVCSIYATRPAICRDLERASAACQGEIHEKADRPLLALRRERAHASRPIKTE